MYADDIADYPVSGRLSLPAIFNKSLLVSSHLNGSWPLSTDQEIPGAVSHIAFSVVLLISIACLDSH